MKRLATVSTFTLILVSCASSVGYSDDHNTLTNTPATLNQATPGSSFIDTIIEIDKEQTMLEQQARAALDLRIKKAKEEAAMIKNGISMDQGIEDLKKYLGKTWYVFSGSTPRGWDCSGLVKWYYEELGIDIPHSATKQGQLKPKVKDPKAGDIVVFRYIGNKNHHHSAIYIGENKVIHAGFKKGDRAEVISLDDPAFKNNEIHFIRIIERN